MWVCHSFFYVNDMPMLAKKKKQQKNNKIFPPLGDCPHDIQSDAGRDHSSSYSYYSPSAASSAIRIRPNQNVSRVPFSFLYFYL
jgi:hypothetical protein